MTATICWIVLMIIFAVVEVIVLNLNFIWYGVGALLAAVASVFGAPVWLQCIVFAVVTLVTLIAVRPIVRRSIENKKEQMRKDAERETDKTGGMEQ